MRDIDLKPVLKECNKSARIGYKIASTQEKNLNRALISAREKIINTIVDFNSSQCYSPETSELLNSQLMEIQEAFDHLSSSLK